MPKTSSRKQVGDRIDAALFDEFSEFCEQQGWLRYKMLEKAMREWLQREREKSAT